MTESGNDQILMALEEAEAWRSYDGPRGVGGIGPSLAAKFGRPAGTIQCRHLLYLAGHDATPLWEKIEKGMPLRAAVRLWRNAKRRAEADGSSLRSAVLLEISAYESVPGHTFVTPDGRVVKRRVYVRDDPDSDPSPEPEPEPDPSPSPDPSTQTSGHDPGQDPWARVKSALDDLFKSQTKDLEDDVATKLRAEFNVEIKRVVSWLKQRVYLSSKSPSERLLIARPRREIVAWCQVLHMDPPRVGRPVDCNILRRQYRALSLAYHPDRNPGRPEMEEKQRAVNMAYDGLTGYNELLKESV